MVSECNGHCVSVFSPRGEKLRSFDTRGSSRAEFMFFPIGVAVNGKGNNIAADKDNHSILYSEVHIKRPVCQGCW